jgi:hypothetical protein
MLPLFFIMINLNNFEYSQITSELILQKVSEYDIFKYYIPNLELNRPINSPLRTDNIPSFSVFYASKINKLLFKDFATKEKGDCFVFVSKLFCINYYETLLKIAFDFNIINNDISVSNNKKIQLKKIDYKNKVSIHLGIKKQLFTQKDIIFWNSYGISEKTLKEYNVYSCSHIFINDYIFVINNNSNPAYAYLELKDNKVTYKIYQPFNTNQRFISNVDKSIWQGWTQLPDKGENLIITKSLKDVMSIVENTKIPSVSLQAETTDPKPHIIDELKSRFKNIYLLYDNDFNKDINWGNLYGNELSLKYKINQIEIPNKYKSKDFSDLVKNHGINKSKLLIFNLLNL